MNKARCDELYRLLLGRGNEWMSQEEICGIYGVNGGVFHNSAARRNLSQDIQDINESPEYEKIIISGSRGIKIANTKEAIDYIGGLYDSVFRRLRRIRVIAKKAGSDGQMSFDGKTVKAFFEE